MSVRVDWRSGLSAVGTIVAALAVPLVVPLVTAVLYGESVVPFLGAMALCLALGGGLWRLHPDPDIGVREGFFIVAVTWAAVAAVGAVPYLIAAHGVPGIAGPISPSSTLANPANALFESMSGFTTTGATVLGEISFDRHSRSILIWRQLTQWLGGMGIVVLMVAVLPRLSVGGAQLIDAEAPGPGIEKLTPRIAETARALWGIYLGLTAAEMALLYGLHVAGLAPNMTLYNAIAHGLTTMPTGGFSPEARSIEAFSAAVQWAIVPFMIAAGTNFALFWRVLVGDADHVRENGEFRFYLGILGAVGALVAGLLFTGAGFVDIVPAGESYDAAYLDGLRSTIVTTVEPAARHAAFQVASIVTTTGYVSLDFNAWSQPAQYVLLFAMFVGGSAGSTGGSIKIIRWYVLLKSLRRELFTTVHPDAVRPIRIGDRTIDERTVGGIYAFSVLYLVLFALATLLLFLESVRAGPSLSVIEATSAAAATLGNVGPGFGIVGPMNNYLPFSAPAKLFMTVLMWIGRLEILPVLVLFTPAFWRS